MGDSRGSIAFFGTYRPPVPLDIYSCPTDPPPSSREDELHLTDGVSYNQNGRAIPAAALKELLTFLGKKNPKLAAECGATPDDADKGRVAGLVFVSERDSGLETLHVALVRSDGKTVAKVLRLADFYGADIFGGARLEDSGCIAGGFKAGVRAVGHSLVYVSTKEPVTKRRTPWTVVYKTNLADGKTERLTPPGQYDLSPAVSPSGKMVAVANFRGNKWTGEIERLNTDIAVMNVDKTAQGGLGRKILIRDGGWPTWGSDGVLFFHRGTETKLPAATGTTKTNWGVYRYDIATKKTVRMTPETIDAMTPAAISETRVAVATIRQTSLQAVMTVQRVDAQYRHVEIFDVGAPDRPVQITRSTRPKADHYNPFVVDGGSRVGYHRCRTDDLLGVIH
jgi:Tol biopolymer transport system component